MVVMLALHKFLNAKVCYSNHTRVETIKRHCSSFLINFIIFSYCQMYNFYMATISGTSVADLIKKHERGWLKKIFKKIIWRSIFLNIPCQPIFLLLNHFNLTSVCDSIFTFSYTFFLKSYISSLHGQQPDCKVEKSQAKLAHVAVKAYRGKASEGRSFAACWRIW